MTAEQLTADAMRRATIEAGRDDDNCALAWSDALAVAACKVARGKTEA